MASRSAPETPALLHVRPAPRYRAVFDDDGEVIRPVEYVVDLPDAGRLMTPEEAQPLLDAGLAVIEPAAEPDKESV